MITASRIKHKVIETSRNTIYLPWNQGVKGKGPHRRMISMMSCFFKKHTWIPGTKYGYWGWFPELRGYCFPFNRTLDIRAQRLADSFPGTERKQRNQNRQTRFRWDDDEGGWWWRTLLMKTSCEPNIKPEGTSGKTDLLFARCSKKKKSKEFYNVLGTRIHPPEYIKDPRIWCDFFKIHLNQ